MSQEDLNLAQADPNNSDISAETSPKKTRRSATSKNRSRQKDSTAQKADTDLAPIPGGEKHAAKPKNSKTRGKKVNETTGSQSSAEETMASPSVDEELFASDSVIPVTAEPEEAGGLIGKDEDRKQDRPKPQKSRRSGSGGRNRKNVQLQIPGIEATIGNTRASHSKHDQQELGPDAGFGADGSLPVITADAESDAVLPFEKPSAAIEVLYESGSYTGGKRDGRGQAGHTTGLSETDTAPASQDDFDLKPEIASGIDGSEDGLIINVPSNDFKSGAPAFAAFTEPVPEDAFPVMGESEEPTETSSKQSIMDEEALSQVKEADSADDNPAQKGKSRVKRAGLKKGKKIAGIDRQSMTDDASASEDETLKEKQEDALHRKAGKEVRRVLYVSAEPDEQVEVVITEDGVITEYFVEMSHQAKIRGNIYKGVIRNIDVNLQAAFVDFGSGKNGFLQIDEVHPEYWHAPRQSGDGKYPPIQKVLKEGDELLVQAVKEPAGSKGAFLTTWLSLAGRYLVLTPGQEQIGVSRKVSNPEERQRLKGLLSGIEPGEGYGVIIRTASEGADSESIGQDLLFLKKLYEQILRRAINSEAPCLLYEEADLVSRTVRDYWETNIDAIHIDSEEIYYGLKNYIDLVFPGQGGILKFYKEQRLSMWEKFGLQKQLSEITGREVVLPSGGRLVFDQTEALMAIDINSGKTQGKSNFEAMVYRTNLEAAEAIARHLRLRDIGGQVVIDFIEMKDRTHCREVEKTIRNAMRRDRARHDVGHISQFGLLELVRQRTGTSAISITSEPCPHCGGTGVRRNMEWQAQGVLREIKHKISCKNPPSICIHEVPFELGLYVLNNKRDKLNELEAAFGVKIEIKPV